MASREPYYFYKETRLNFEPSSSAFTVDVELPSATAQTKGRRHANGSATVPADTDAFRARHCATASGTYRRKHHQFPASFLWRVLEDDTVLSLRAIDVCRPKKASDTNLVLNFHFANPIIPTCVALTDPSDHDALTVFVLDTANQLHTLFLRPDSFRKRSSAAGLDEICKIYTSKAFQFKKPYRLVAVNSDQLIINLADGGLIRFDRQSHNPSLTPWKETFYNAKGWVQGIRSMIGNRSSLDITAAAAAVQTGLGLNNASYLFTVCLDHRLRIWNLNSGQILGAMDLLNAPRDPQETGKWQLDSTQTNLIRIVGETEGKRLCVTYSPVGSGQFKFWRLQSDDENSVDVHDLYPEAQFTPTPPLGSDVWTLADFSVAERETAHGFKLWILWKNNMAYRVQELSFLMDELPDVWHGRWRSVFLDTVVPTAPATGPSDPTESTERWLQLILSPGRFPKATLEAGLNAYERALGKSGERPTRSSQGLADAICSAISSTASLTKNSTGEMDHERFRASSEMQWRKFYRILVELDKPRGEALALAYESESGMPWVVCADSIAAIRECSALEQIYHNPQAQHEDPEGLPALITTGCNFVDGFSDGMRQICQSVLRSELFEDTSKTDQERIQSFSDKAGFWRQITDEDCQQVTDMLGPNFDSVSTKVYQRVLATCDETWDSHHPTEHPLTEFGRQIIVRAAQDMAELLWKVCFGQLILLVHMEFEFDRPDDALHNRINIGVVYRMLLRSLGRLELIRWLANTQISTPLSKTDRSESVPGGSPVVAKRPVEEFKTITALEGNVGHLLGLPEAELIPAAGMPSIITKLVADLCAPDSEVELQPQYIQCGLIVRDRADLAVELAPFCDQDPFSTYVQGRVYLALKDYTTAETYFRKAAYGMSLSQAEPSRHSSGLLDEIEWKRLYAGMPQYYAHIVALYERQKAYSYVVEFARLALQFVGSKTNHADDVRSDIQNRLFSAATAVSQFELAHSTLVAMKNPALQHGCLRMLIQRMCDNLHNAELVELPFPGLQNDVDDILAQRCHGTVDVITGVPYHQILYSWRIKRNDYRGAAAILLDRIQKLRQLGEGDQLTGDDVLDTAITRQYLMLINVLSCVEQKQAWITTEHTPHQINGAEVVSGGSERKVVTLADIRKDYQEELDRIAAIQNNQFGFAAGDEMEIL
ncbi:Uu.00g014470.m01.CDS01 [Anthostomella pinea]|uniref:Uu.00g014470.m01.CDS01 n=1 Tax=Anthostomella pinea TaxID=933095 RepID=A0AAI8VYB3_9PEZI|nr:Uu.00g014470.m01.CDS01 [Anthostomella pinea]